ncbi:hypothetical protein DV735_g882, partial [Chaetothyriales sp. CBS 134920]
MDGIQNSTTEDADSEIPTIPLTEDYFEQLVLTAEKELRECQEYMVQAILNQERTACRHAPGPELIKQSASPFEAIKVQTTGEQTCELVIRDPPVGGASNKPGTTRSITTAISKVATEVKSLPRYKSIGRLGQMPMARNVTIGKYTPYFPEDEGLPEEVRESKYQELRDRYKAFQDFYPAIQAQRDCVERCAMWRPFILDLMNQLRIDRVAIVSFFKAGEILGDNFSGIGDSALAVCLGAQSGECAKCGLDSRSRWEFEELWERAQGGQITQPQSLLTAGLLAAAFLKTTGLLLWHVFYEDGALIEDLLRLGQERYQRIRRSQGDARATSESLQSKDQPKDRQNIHAMVTQPKARLYGQNKHVCGVYCVEDADEHGVDLRGLRENGQVTGKFRTEMERSRSSFDPKEACGEDCFWDVRQRSREYRKAARLPSKSGLWPDQLLAYEKCLEMCLGNERGACMMKSFVDGVSCVDLFHIMLQDIRAVKHQGADQPQRKLSAKNSNGPRKWKGKRKGREETTKLEDRPVFVPCYHPGPCQDNPSCGVAVVLDQANKYREDIRKHRCMNNRIQLGLPARTIKAPSEVQGFGLFAGEDIPRNGFIGEYKGEVTSRGECDRRGSAYHLSGMEYLFNLNQDQEVDASSFGNKTRFLNNSSNEQNINVVGSTMLCNGVQRVMLCAKRDIKAGEELLFDYKYPEHVRENFWERGEGDASKNAMALAPGGQRSTSKSETAQAVNGKGKGRASKGSGSGQSGSDSDSDSGGGITGLGRRRPQTRARVVGTGEAASSDSEFDPTAKPVVMSSSSDEEDWQGHGRDSIAESVSDR